MILVEKLINVDVVWFLLLLLFVCFAYKHNEWDTKIISEHQHFYSNLWCPWVSVTWGVAELVEFLCESVGGCWHQSPLVEQATTAHYLFPYSGGSSCIEIYGENSNSAKSSRNNFKYNYKYYVLLIKTLCFQGIRRNERNYRFFFPRPS